MEAPGPKVILKPRGEKNQDVPEALPVDIEEFEIQIPKKRAETQPLSDKQPERKVQLDPNPPRTRQEPAPVDQVWKPGKGKGKGKDKRKGKSKGKGKGKFQGKKKGKDMSKHQPWFIFHRN